MYRVDVMIRGCIWYCCISFSKFLLLLCVFLIALQSFVGVAGLVVPLLKRTGWTTSEISGYSIVLLVFVCVLHLLIFLREERTGDHSLERAVPLFFLLIGSRGPLLSVFLLQT